MTTFINVRGCNGSGKTHLLRQFGLDPLCRVENIENIRHTVKDKNHLLPGNTIECAHSPIPVTYCPGGIAILGDYTPAAAGSTTAGCDRIKTQEATKKALEFIGRDPEVKFVLFEGVVVSTIFGPWRNWAALHGGMVWAFLDTPLEKCLSRIQTRNGGKPVKEDQVADKHRTSARVRDKCVFHGLRVLDLDHEQCFDQLLNAMAEEK